MSLRALPFRLLVALWPALLVAAAPLPAAPTLFPRPAYPADGYPYRVLTGDFNGDGIVDLVTGNYNSNDVSILLGDSAGGFSPPSHFPAGTQIIDLVVADLDGDGRLDVASANRGSNDVSVLLGNGDGTLQGERRFPAGTSPSSVAAGDFNGDGRPDLVVVNYSDLSILLNTGGGAFSPQPPVAYTYIGQAAPEVLTGRFNQDRLDDFAVITGQAVEIAMARQGSGTFDPLVPYLIHSDGAFNSNGVVADVNGDGRQDILLSSTFSPPTSGVPILFGQGNGTFTIGSVPGFVFGHDLISVDFNGDGRPDLATAVGYNQGGPAVRVHLNLGGSYAGADAYYAGYVPNTLAVADFDKDGILDLAVSEDADRINVLRGTAGGKFPPLLQISVAAATNLMARDFTRDGIADLLLEQPTSSVVVYPGRGDGSFGSPVKTFVSAAGRAAIGDFNGDGNPDLGLPINPDGLTLLSGRGDGSFQIGVSLPTGSHPVAADAADVNGDGALDVVVVNQASDDVSVYLGTGGGALGPQTRFGTGHGPVALALGDLDGNGTVDLVTLNPGSGDLGILLGAGDGRFTMSASLPTDGGSGQVVLTDMNADGALDIAATSDTAHSVTIWLGAGDGTFAISSRSSTPRSGVSLAAADVDRDGREDLVTGGLNQVSVWRGRGDGTVEAAASFVGGNDAGLAAADLDGDGDIDLMHADASEGRVFILLNASPGGGNRPPIARIVAPATVECSGFGFLDGSTSSDPDSTPGTHDDIILFEWFEDYGASSQTLLGTGERLSVRFLLGPHRITLCVTDRAGLSGLAEATIVGTDTVKPALDCTPHTAIDCDCSGGAQVRVTASVSDACDTNVAIFHDGVAGSDASGVYAPGLSRVHFTAVDDSGNVATCDTTVYVGGPSLAGLFPDRVFQAGDAPGPIVVDDFNRDGTPDVVVANVGSADLSYFLGEHGGLRPETRLPVGGTLSGIVAGDWNGDGRPDLAVATGAGEAVILLASDDGSFGEARRYPASQYASGVSFGRLDGNATLDLALTDPSTDTVVILAGRGDGTFTTAARVDAGPSLDSVAIADFNRDGCDDLALTHGTTSPYITILLGRCDGTFSGTGDTIPAEGGPQGLFARDVNSDGAVDLVVSEGRLDDVLILLGNGRGGFAASGRFAAGDDPRQVAAADFDQDGRIDLAVVSYLSGDVTILRGRGDGMFDRAETIPGHPTNRTIGAADWNGDGLPDIALPEPTGPGSAGGVGILFNPWPADFQDVHPHFAVSPVVMALKVGDFNRDGRRDLAWSSFSGSTGAVYVALGRGSGAFDPPRSIYGGGGPIEVADFNEDGLDDIVTLVNGVYVLINRGDGTFSPVIPSLFHTTSVAVGDFNGDRHQDIVVLDSDAGTITFFPGRGDGSFGASRTSPGTSADAQLMTGDFNGDGKRDLILTYIAFDGVAFSRGLGDGAFAAPSGVGMGFGRTVSAAAGDFNSDGIDDVVAAAEVGGQFAVRLGHVDSTFGPPIVFRLRRRPGAMATADWDGDGRLDLAILVDSTVQVMMGLGDGTFGSSGRFSLVAGFSTLLVSADFDGDRAPDLAVDSALPSQITVLLNRLARGGNRPPLAVTAWTVQAECVSPTATTVRLDGSGSSDPDSTPGTRDDIVGYQWLEDYGLSTQHLVATGVIADASFTPGSHAVSLKVTDRAGETGVAPLSVRVVDTLPPVLTIRTAPVSLWPANHRMVDVLATVVAVDACGPATFILQDIRSNEPDDAPGGTDGQTQNDIQDAAIGTADVAFRLRAERDSQGTGRIYTVTYVASDASSHSTTLSVQIPVCRVCAADVAVSVTVSNGHTIVDWTGIEGASAFRLARGDVRDLMDSGDAYDIGPVAVLGSVDAPGPYAVSEPTDPLPGRAFFYVVDAFVESWIGYGEESAAKERRAG